MATESAERRAARAHHLGLPGEQQQQPEPLACPRCDSMNTKFCYYNNYNFSQPRHFCKACRRYWTHGGTLRDIPIGGGSRKSAKRPRSSTSTASYSSTPVFLPATVACPTPITAVSSASGGGVAQTAVTSSFTSLLTTAAPAGVGVLPLGGLGLGLGLDDVGQFGLGRGVWALPSHHDHHHVGIGYFGGVANGGENGGGNGGVDGGAVSRGDTWQLESGESDFGGGAGDCFSSLPELAISTPAGNGLK